MVDKRASISRPEMGFVKFLCEVLDEKDTVLTTLVSSMMMVRLEPGAAP